MTKRVGLAICGALAACGPKAKKTTPPASVSVELQAAPAVWYGSPPSPPRISGANISTPGLVIAVNDDDSDGDGAADALNNKVDGAADAAQLTRFIIDKVTATPAAGDKLHIVKKSGSGNVRVFREGDASAGILNTGSSNTSTQDAEAAQIMTSATGGDVVIYVEGTAAGDVELCARWTGSATAETCAKFFVVDGYGTSAGFGARIYSDTNRDATVVPADIAGHDTYSASSGAIVFANLDKDCPTGSTTDDDEADSTIACPADEADITEVRVDKARLELASLPAGWKPTLRYLAASSHDFRLFDGIANGASELTATPTYLDSQNFDQADLTSVPSWAAATGEVKLGVEGRALDKPIDLFVCLTDMASKVDAACDKVALRTNPAFLQPNTEGEGNVAVLDHPLNASMRTDMTAAMPGGTTLVPVAAATANGDPWLQDEIEIAGIRAPRGDAQLVLHLPRNRGLKDWAEGQRRAGIGVLDLRSATAAADPDDQFDSPQYGGNLECSPPAAGGPGMLIVGDDMDPGLIAALGSAAPAQAPLSIPTKWLAVGHVDEIAGVVPTPTGWRTTVGDPDLARSLLLAAPEKAALFWSCNTPARSRAPECYREGSVTSASASTTTTRAKLTASGTDFTRPTGRELGWVRIYKGTGRGQVARIVTSATTAHTLEVDLVFKLPNVEWPRCIASGGSAQMCDTGVTLPTTESDFKRNSWFTVPDTTSRFVAVESSLSWVDTSTWKLPALVTAGELSDATVNANFWADEPLVEAKSNAVASALATLPGGSSPIRVPVLYTVIASGGSIVPRTGDALLPGLANYQVVRGSSGTVIFAPRPFGPSTGGADPFETAFTSALASSGATVTFVDDWDLYHRNTGEVHCGTNLFKSVARRWWP